MKSSTLLISARDQKKVLAGNMSDCIEVVENAFKENNSGKVFLPDKISKVFDEDKQNRINCMPGALLDSEVYGAKWISVFPENPDVGIKNVNGTIILSELKHGQTVSVMDAGYLTAIRTASVGAVAAKYLSDKDSKTVGFIGAGQEARRHFEMLKVVRPGINKCYVSSRTDKTVQEFVDEEKAKYPDVDFVCCSDRYEDAVNNVDIIVTATSCQRELLKARWIKKGAFYIHVAGLEDEYKVAQMADKIICDDWESVKHRTQTISRMYAEELLTDSDITGNLGKVIDGTINRNQDDKFIYFCSVGLAFIDVAFAKFIYDRCVANGLGYEFDFAQE